MDEVEEYAKDDWRMDEYDWVPSELRARRKTNLSILDGGCPPKQGKGTLPEAIKDNKQPCRKGNKNGKTMCQASGQKQVGCDVAGCKNTCTGTYYRKYRVCQEHAKAPVITIQGQPVRFCQKCAKLEPLSAFDGEYRSCRVTLERHNKRRRMRNAEKGKPVRSTRKESAPKTGSPIKKMEDSSVAAENAGMLFAGVEIHESKKESEPFDLNNLLADELTSGQTSSKGGSARNMRDVMINSVDYSLFASDPNMKDIYKGEDVEFHLSLKFQNGTPEDLPHSFMDDITGSLPSISYIEGALRPGCTHVTATIRMNRREYEEFMARTSISSLAGNFYAKWRGLKSLSRGFQAQMNDCSVQFASDGSHVITRSSLSRIASISTCVVESDTPAIIDVVGQYIDSPKLIAFCRQNGRYLTTTILADTDTEDSIDGYNSDDSDLTEASSLSSSSVSYHHSDSSEDLGGRTDSQSGEQHISLKILGLTPGICEIELMQDNILTESVPVLVLPSAKPVEEVRAIVANQDHISGCKDLLRDIGMVIRHVYGAEPLPSHMVPIVQRLAVKTISYCMEKRAVHLVGLLQMALPEDQCRCKEIKKETDFREMSLLKGNHKRKFEPGVQSMNYRLINDLSKQVSEMDMRTTAQDFKWMNILGQIVIGIGLIFLAIVATGVDIRSPFTG